MQRIAKQKKALKCTIISINKANSIDTKDAVQSFKTASSYAEKIHAQIYLDAKNNLEKWKTSDKPFAVCGWTVDGEVPDSCPDYKVPKSKLLKFNDQDVF